MLAGGNFLLVILNERFQSLWYKIAVGNSIFNNASCCKTFERQVVHDGDVVEGVGSEE